MEKRGIGILDGDRLYTELLLSYFRTSEFRSLASLKVFSSLEAWRASGGDAALLLADPGLLGETDPGCAVVYLEEAAPDGSERKGRRIRKFQPLHLFFQEIIRLLDETGSVPLPDPAPGSCRTIAVYSAAGGAGKTTAAANLCRMLALQNKRVFYFNLESHHAMSLFPAEDNRGFEQMLYSVKAGSPQASARLDKVKASDAGGRIDLLAPLRNPSELEEMTGVDALSFLKLLQSKGYDYVIVDCDSFLSDRIRAVLLSGCELLWLVTDDALCLGKTRAAYRSLFENGPADRPAPRIHYLLNKYTGKMVNDPAGFGISLAGSLPYIPEWKSVASPGQLLREPVFQQHLLRWMGKREEEREGGKASGRAGTPA
ncbi:hypothetical protein J31TS4_05830 [Paenibacillus sp. J31TS4]|uniref:AAA family ATPase n=1 Tax=Paenibacillus sp. J31TS4 TaxID=2807195 RepID=UPI001B0B915E|nr:AAA family ATPase [Paenibacillus sp. J31TS4]GIP37303.1 hypothetical protein J31TS4_05830 [Paenibacillus sp. J31TS4]